MDLVALRDAAAPVAREGAAALAKYEAHAKAEQQSLAASRAAASWAATLAALVTRRHVGGCWANAVTSVASFDCRGLGGDAHRRLALALASCSLQAAGKPGLMCAPTTPFASCTRRMSNDAWTSYELAVRDANAICFHTRLEGYVHNLTSTAAETAAALVHGLDVLATGQAEAIRTGELSLRLAAQQLAAAEEQLAAGRAAAEAADAQADAIAGVAAAVSQARPLGWVDARNKPSLNEITLDDPNRPSNTASSLFLASDGCCKPRRWRRAPSRPSAARGCAALRCARRAAARASALSPPASSAPSCPSCARRARSERRASLPHSTRSSATTRGESLMPQSPPPSPPPPPTRRPHRRAVALAASASLRRRRRRMTLRCRRRRRRRRGGASGEGPGRCRGAPRGRTRRGGNADD